MWNRQNLEAPLYEYDPEIQGTGPGRMGRVLQLRDAIRRGRYDLEGGWTQLVDNMAERLGGTRRADEL